MSSLRQRLHAGVTIVVAVTAAAVGIGSLGGAVPTDSQLRIEALSAARDVTADDHGINEAGYLGDLAPAGIDVTEPVSTEALDVRAEALEAAATSAVKAGEAGPRRHVGCVGDGVSGPRVEALYVVPAGRPDRYGKVVGNLRTYIARADSVFLDSARQTGGYRQVRWVHDSSCRPVVRKVKVAAAAAKDFSSTQRALKDAGYSRADRKYLIFMDASKLCGIGSVYLDNRPGQENYNNGRVAQYARVDAPCWGLKSHSVEAHELTHTFGAVLTFAPNRTAGGHCSDESDIMCYSDTPTAKMRKVCAAKQEQLLDCGADDYFSTKPRPGSALAKNWNAANSAFLFVPPAPNVASTRPSYTPGLRTRVAVAPKVPSGQGWQIRWSAPTGCTLSARRTGSADTGADPRRVSVHCPATRGSAVVTARLVQQDGRGATTRVTLTAPARPRPARVSVTSVRRNGTVQVKVRALDAATKKPAYGVPVTVKARINGKTRTLVTGSTTADGTRAWSRKLPAGTRLTVSTASSRAFAAAKAASVTR